MKLYTINATCEQVKYTISENKDNHKFYSISVSEILAEHNIDGFTIERVEGYYSGANVNIYTGDDLIDIGDDGYDNENEVTKDKIDIARVVQVVKENTQGFRRTATFSNGESIYERGE